MNWLIWEKMFTYFYNKFRPVNRMYYIKCGVNSSLLTSVWLLHKVCGTLDHCIFTTHSIHIEGDILQIYFCVISTKQGTTRRPTSHLAHLYTVPLLCPWERRKQNSGLILLAIVSSGYFCWVWLLLLFSSSSKSSSNIASFRTLFRSCVSNQNFTDGFLLKFYLFFSSHCSRPTIICLV